MSFSYLKMDESKDVSSSTSDYLEPKSTVSIPTTSQDNVAGWNGRLSEFWYNMVSTLRSRCRTKRKPRIVRPSQNATTVEDYNVPTKLSRSGTWKYVDDGKTHSESHTYYNLIEEFYYKGPNESISSNRYNTFAGRREAKMKPSKICRGKKMISCEHNIVRHIYILDNYIFLQVI